jgi:hypothetical protein
MAGSRSTSTTSQRDRGTTYIVAYYRHTAAPGTPSSSTGRMQQPGGCTRRRQQRLPLQCRCVPDGHLPLDELLGGPVVRRQQQSAATAATAAIRHRHGDVFQQMPPRRTELARRRPLKWAWRSLVNRTILGIRFARERRIPARTRVRSGRPPGRLQPRLRSRVSQRGQTVLFLSWPSRRARP